MIFIAVSNYVILVKEMTYSQEEMGAKLAKVGTVLDMRNSIIMLFLHFQLNLQVKSKFL